MPPVRDDVTTGGVSARASGANAVDKGFMGGCVECGMWRGGSALEVAVSFLDGGATDPETLVVDMVTGMTAPREVDALFRGEDVRSLRAFGPEPNLCDASIDKVRANRAVVGYAVERFHSCPAPSRRRFPTGRASRSHSFGSTRTAGVLPVTNLSSVTSGSCPAG